MVALGILEILADVENTMMKISFLLTNAVHVVEVHSTMFQSTMLPLQTKMQLLVSMMTQLVILRGTPALAITIYILQKQHALKTTTLRHSLLPRIAVFVVAESKIQTIQPIPHQKFTTLLSLSLE